MILIILVATILLVVVIKKDPKVSKEDLEKIFTKQRIVLCLVVVLCATVPTLLVRAVTSYFPHKKERVVVVCWLDGGLLGINCE